VLEGVSWQPTRVALALCFGAYGPPDVTLTPTVEAAASPVGELRVRLRALLFYDVAGAEIPNVIDE